MVISTWSWEDPAGDSEQSLKKCEALRHRRLGEESRPASAEPWPLVDKDCDSEAREGDLRQHSQGTRALLVPGPPCKASGLERTTSVGFPGTLQFCQNGPC